MTWNLQWILLELIRTEVIGWFIWIEFMLWSWPCVREVAPLCNYMLYVCQLGIITLSPSVHATMAGHPFIFSPIYFFNFSFIVQFSKISLKNSCKLIIIKRKKIRKMTFFFFFFLVRKILNTNFGNTITFNQATYHCTPQCSTKEWLGSTSCVAQGS